MSTFTVTTPDVMSLDAQEGPLYANSWSMESTRRPPPDFFIQMSPPIRTSRGYLFTLEIKTAIDHLPTPSINRSSVSLAGGYTIWRDWEDFLHFQDWVETEFTLAARNKKRQLTGGKKSKKPLVSSAASFASLPNGPDPKSIVTNVHHYLPKLSKKAALTSETLQSAMERHNSIRVFLEKLFSSDMPVLVQDMLTKDEVANFFSLWRKDTEFMRKRAKKKAKEEAQLTNDDTASHKSGVSKLSSAYFSWRTSKTSSTGLKSPASPSSSFSSQGSRDSVSSTIPTGFRRVVRSSNSSGSSDDSLASLPVSPVDRLAQEPMIAGEDDFARLDSSSKPLMLVNDLSSSVAALHFGNDLKSKDAQLRRRDSIASTSSWRSGTSFAESIPEEYYEQFSRFDWSASSDSSLSPASPSNYGPRDSVASFATGRTECSADAILYSPTGSEDLSHRHSWSTISSSLTSFLPSEYGHPLVYDEAPLTPGPNGRFPQDSVSVLDVTMSEESNDARTPVRSCFPNRPPSLLSVATTSTTFSQASNAYGMIDTMLEEPKSGSRCPTPTGDIPSSITIPGAEHLPTFLPPRTPRTPRTPHTPYTPQGPHTPLTPKTPLSAASTTSMATTVTSGTSLLPNQLTVKAFHNSTITNFKIERDMSFKELREMLLYKFSDDEVKLSKSFAIAWLPRTTSSHGGVPNFEEMKFIQSEASWLNALTVNGAGKMILKAIGDEAT